jgi:hypothetical protein
MQTHKIIDRRLHYDLVGSQMQEGQKESLIYRHLVDHAESQRPGSKSVNDHMREFHLNNIYRFYLLSERKCCLQPTLEAWARFLFDQLHLAWSFKELYFFELTIECETYYCVINSID